MTTKDDLGQEIDMELPIGIGGVLDPWRDVVVVLATLAYPKPDDALARRNLCYDIHLKKSEMLRSREDNPAGGLARDIMIMNHSDPEGMAQYQASTLGSPRGEKAVLKLSKSMKQAHIAGRMLEWIISGRRNHPELNVGVSSMINAMAFVAQSNPPEGRLIKTEEGFWGLWKKYKNASHLLAVHGRAISAEDGGEPSYWTRYFKEMLVVAEAIRLEAETHRIVAEGELWRVPSSLNITPWPGLGAEAVSALPPDLLEALETLAVEEAFGAAEKLCTGLVRRPCDCRSPRFTV